LFNDKLDELNYLENLIKLKPLLNQADITERIMIAEINRNLGDFDNCISVIQSICDDSFNSIQERFLRECELKNKWVVQLK
jgi:hypothetical protein